MRGDATALPISVTGALAWRGACVAGSGWREAGVARHAGQVARVVRSAGCRGTRKVWRGEAARRRELVEKEGGGVRARGLGGGRRGGRGGERPGRRGVQVACGVGSGRAGASADVEMRLTRPIEKVTR